MFGNLLQVRLRAAERALRDGRWDEAYRLAVEPELREQPRAAAVREALAPLLLGRAREHFRGERLAEARADLDRASACCGGGARAAEITELRGHVEAVAAELQRREHVRRGAVEEARRRVEAGSLIGGQRALAEAGSDAEAEQLRARIARRSEDAARAAREAVEMMAADQWNLAADRIRRARTLDPHEGNVVRAEATLCQTVLERARAALLAGKIDRAADELHCAEGLGDALPEKRELTRQVQVARQAAAHVAGGKYEEAQDLIATLLYEMGRPEWLAAAQEQLKNLETLQDALRAGPLGAAAGVEAVGAAAPGRRVVPVMGETIAAPVRSTGAGLLPDRLLLLVDGGGSYLVLRGGMASIGRAASADPADVALYSDIGERHATIARMEEDYFLTAARDVEVGGRMVRHHLLRDGDRLALGRKAKLTFHLPSRCSASAVLALSDTTKMPQDVRRVVLLNGHATIGRDATAHIVCRQAGGALVLFEREGRLWVRNRHDGHADREAWELKLAAPVEQGGVRLVLNSWESRA